MFYTEKLEKYLNESLEECLSRYKDCRDIETVKYLQGKESVFREVIHRVKCLKK